MRSKCVCLSVKRPLAHWLSDYAICFDVSSNTKLLRLIAAWIESETRRGRAGRHIWQKSDLLRFSVFTLLAFLKDLQQSPGD